MQTIFYFLVTSILCTLSPGPDIFYVLTLSLSQGTRRGIALACGLSSGVLVHTTLVYLGVAAFIQTSPVAFACLKYAGALYLIFLAYKAFTSPTAVNLENISIQQKSFFKFYRQGILMNVLNPKVLLFFLALFPQFIQFNASTGKQIFFLGFLFALQANIIFSLLATFAGKIRQQIFQKNSQKIFKILQKLEGVILAIIALALFFM